MKNNFEYKPGDLILVEGKSVISKIISLFTKSKFTHIALHTGLEGMLIESDFGGVQYNFIDEKYKNYNYSVYRYKDGLKAIYALNYAESKLGKGYDYSGLVGIALEIVGLSNKNYLDDKNKYWCSELVADSYLNAGVNLPVNKNTSKVSPADFAKMSLFKKVYENNINGD